jgi:hypothetical protein
MDSFTPIFSKIVDSSIWEETYQVRVLWTTILALKDSDHIVRYNAYRLSRRANMTEQEVLDALEVLLKPDTRRLEEQPHDGRRLEKVEDGYLVLNGHVYEQMMRDVSRKVYKARKEREYRERRKSAALLKNGSSTSAAYEAAAGAGASPEQLDAIVTDKLPKRKARKEPLEWVEKEEES